MTRVVYPRIGATLLKAVGQHLVVQLNLQMAGTITLVSHYLQPIIPIKHGH